MMNGSNHIAKLILVFLAIAFYLGSANAGQDQSMSPASTFEIRPLPTSVIKDTERVFIYKDHVLKGPDWNTLLRGPQLRLTQSPRKRVSLLFSFTAESPVERANSSEGDVSFKFELVDKQRRVLDTFVGFYSRRCGSNTENAADHKSKSSYRLSDVDSVTVTERHNLKVHWCSRGHASAAGSPIFLDPNDFLFAFPASADGTNLSIATVAGPKYSFRPAATGQIYIDRNPTNPDLLDFSFRAQGTQHKDFLQSVGREEQVTLVMSYEAAIPCNEPRHMFGGVQGPDPGYYVLRGFFVPSGNGAASKDWTPISVVPGDRIVFRDISSVAVYDPPPLSSNRLIFYVGCRKEADLPYSTVEFVFASPSSIAQPFIGFGWVPAQIRDGQK